MHYDRIYTGENLIYDVEDKVEKFSHKTKDRNKVGNSEGMAKT